MEPSKESFTDLLGRNTQLAGATQPLASYVLGLTILQLLYTLWTRPVWSYRFPAGVNTCSHKSQYSYHASNEDTFAVCSDHVCQLALYCGHAFLPKYFSKMFDWDWKAPQNVLVLQIGNRITTDVVKCFLLIMRRNSIVSIWSYLYCIVSVCGCDKSDYWQIQVVPSVG